MATCGINAQLLTESNNYRRAGIHVYLSEVLSHLTDHEELDYKIFSTYEPPHNQNAKLEWARTNRFSANPIGRIIWEQFLWPFRNRLGRSSLIHGSAFALPVLNLKPAVVTIFDLSFMHHPELFPPLRRLYLKTATSLSCRLATRVIAISESGKKDLIDLFGISAEKISVVYPGVRSQFKRPANSEIAAFKKAKQLPNRFILHVGTLQPRKNLSLLIEAFAQAAVADVDLVFAGGKGWFYEKIFETVQRLGLEDRIHFPGYVPDEELHLWYAAADLLVFPSIYEGFGMPIIEAMTCGTPVIASNVSAMPEAIGEAGILFDPNDTVMLANCMASVVYDTEKLNKMRELGYVHAKEFSWERAGRETTSIYLDVLGLKE